MDHQFNNIKLSLLASPVTWSFPWCCHSRIASELRHFLVQLGIKSGCVENLLVYRPTTLHTYLLCKKLEWEGLVFLEASNPAFMTAKKRSDQAEREFWDWYKSLANEEMSEIILSSSAARPIIDSQLSLSHRHRLRRVKGSTFWHSFGMRKCNFTSVLLSEELSVMYGE